MREPNSKLLAIPSVQTVLRCLAVASMLTIVTVADLPVSRAQETTTAVREESLEDFTQRVNEYVSLKKKLTEGLPKVKSSDVTTGRLEQHEDTLAARIMAARKDAKAGDIFGDAAPYFRRIIQRDTRTRGTRDAGAAREEVPPKSAPTVNALYPEKAALATVPPLILVNLPRLPDELEYRFMGRDLILRDREANVVVDFVTNVVPAVKP